MKQITKPQEPVQATSPSLPPGQAPRDIGQAGQVAGGRLMSIQELLRHVVLRIERQYDNDKKIPPPSVRTGSGYIDLDVFSAAVVPGNLTVIAGASGIGKTALALQVAQYVASELYEKSVAIFSFRESGREIAERLISLRGILGIDKIHAGDFEDNDWALLTHGLGVVDNYDVRVCHAEYMKMAELRERCRERHQELLRYSRALGLVIIDDLQCLGSSLDTNVAAMLPSIKEMATELHVPVIVTSGLSCPRAMHEDGRSRLSDLASCEAISREADMVLLIHRDDSSLSSSKQFNKSEICVALHKNGPIGIVPFLFDNRYLCFRNRVMQFQLDKRGATFEQWMCEHWISTFGGTGEMH